MSSPVEGSLTVSSQKAILAIVAPSPSSAPSSINYLHHHGIVHREHSPLYLIALLHPLQRTDNILYPPITVLFDFFIIDIFNSASMMWQKIAFFLHEEALENHLDIFQLLLSREATILDEQVQKNQAWYLTRVILLLLLLLLLLRSRGTTLMGEKG